MLFGEPGPAHVVDGVVVTPVLRGDDQRAAPGDDPVDQFLGYRDIRLSGGGGSDPSTLARQASPACVRFAPQPSDKHLVPDREQELWEHDGYTVLALTFEKLLADRLDDVDWDQIDGSWLALAYNDQENKTEDSR